jgi:DNA-directed RNA polymerase subunit K/omega
LIPIYEIVDYTGNRYLLSKAIMKRGRQINFMGDDELEKYSGKIVSLAQKQILCGDLNFSLVEEEGIKE